MASDQKPIQAFTPIIPESTPYKRTAPSKSALAGGSEDYIGGRRPVVRDFYTHFGPADDPSEIINARAPTSG